MRLRLARALVASCCVLASLPVLAQDAQPGRVAARKAPATDTSALTPAERGELTRTFVRKWGAYVQQTYGIPVRTWADRMVPLFASVDPDNFLEAVSRTTFEGATAALYGRGARLGDDHAREILSQVSNGSAPQALGSLAADLVYTPVTPCRIVDTRSTAAGAIAANSGRNFLAINASNFSSQGGSSTNCGTLGLNATAVALNVTAVLPSGTGYATVYPYGITQPVTASINYAPGAIVNNALIVQIPNPLGSFDFTVYTVASSHYVADIVGYFAPPVATPVDCVETTKTEVSIAAGGTSTATAPACASGYTATATNCESSSWDMPFVFSSRGLCSAKNNGTGAATLRAGRTCCRVPGR